MSKRTEWAIVVRLVPPGRPPDRIDIDDRILTWEFDDVESESDRLTLTVDNFDLRNFDTPVWKKGAEIEVQYGYHDNLSLARRMIIKKVTGGTRLSVIAYSKAYLLDTVKRCRTFDNIKRSDAVHRVADENGFGPDRRFIDDTETVHETVQQARQTDAQFIRDLARREGFEFYVDGDGLHFHTRRIEDPPVRELTWYQDTTGTILRFNVKNDVTLQPSRYRIVGRDRRTKKDYSFDVDATADIRRTLARKADVPPLSKQIVDSTKNIPVVNIVAAAVAQIIRSFEPNEEAAKKVYMRRIARRRQKIVQMDMTIVGDPGLLAKTIIAIKGFGTTLDGNYYVKRHRHRGQTGYTGELELIRDGRNRRPGGDQLFMPTARSVSDEEANSCDGALARVREAVSALVQARNTLVPAAAAKGVPLDAFSLEATSNKLIFMVDATNLLESTTRERLPPVLDNIKSLAAGFGAGAMGFPSQLQTELIKGARAVIATATDAESACAAEPEPAVNEQTVKEQEAAQLRELEGGKFDFKF